MEFGWMVAEMRKEFKIRILNPEFLLNVES